jgi:hypothetical protein
MALATGCAFGNRHVDLTYPATLPAAPSTAPRFGRVAVAKFDDARTAEQGTGALLGKVRNGYGIPTASVLANQDPVVWVNEGVARALVAQGLTVERVVTPSDPSVPTITGRVTRASGGMYASMDANVSADLTILHQGQTVSTLTCNGEARKVAWTASADEYRTIFEAAMADFANKCGPPLARLLTGSQ